MIELRKITENNFDECIKLEPKEEQKSYVASNICSLAEAYVALTNNECIPMPYAIYYKDIMVGFIMLSYNESNEKEVENVYWVCRLMIDKNIRGKAIVRRLWLNHLNLLGHFLMGVLQQCIFLMNRRILWQKHFMHL